MEPRISMITLGVADITRAREFYASLGWSGQETEETVFVQIGGLALVLWSRAKLAADAGVTDAGPAGGGPGGFGGIALAHNVRLPSEVDAVMAAAEAAGATITRPPATTFYGGYAGYFTDLDGHTWEIAHHPGFPLGDDGSITIPGFGAT